jgi:hypothetical protein
MLPAVTLSLLYLEDFDKLLMEETMIIMPQVKGECVTQLRHPIE